MWDREYVSKAEVVSAVWRMLDAQFRESVRLLSQGDTRVGTFGWLGGCLKCMTELQTETGRGVPETYGRFILAIPNELVRHPRTRKAFEAITLRVDDLRLASHLDWPHYLRLDPALALDVAALAVLRNSGIDAPIRAWRPFIERVIRDARGTDAVLVTAQMLFHRARTAAEPELDGIFMYSGGIDASTHDFCLDRIGCVYSRAAIERMDNGELPDVFLTGGGVGCSCVWMAVCKDSPELPSVDSGQRDKVYAEDAAFARAARERLRAR